MTVSSAMRIVSLASTLLTTLAACNAEVAARDPLCDIGEQEAQVTSAVTSFAFDAKILAELGVTVETTGSIPAARQHSLSLLPGPAHSFAAASECLAVDVADGHLKGFSKGRITHAGGPRLIHGEATTSLAGFELRVGAEPRTFDIVTAAGEAVLRGTLPHYQLDSASGALDVFNVDLSATPALAAAWGAPHLAGFVVGTLTLRGKVRLPSMGIATSALSAAGVDGKNAPLNACDDFSGTVDVALIGMDAVQQRARLGDKVVITPSAVLKNVGTANVPWQAKFSGAFPPYNIDQHPFLVWALYREVGGVFEVLGYSDVKHAFLTINSNCSPGACTVGSVLGLGCEDVYGVGTNSGHLGPRSEITPNAGTWAHCGFPVPNTPSHFDQVAPFCQQDNVGDTESVLEHRAVVSDAELSLANANYYVSSWYVVRDDVNIVNNMGWRRVVPSRTGNTWSFSFATPFRQGSVVDAWVDPSAPTPTRLNVTYKDPVAGSAQLAVSATDLGNGKFRYVYVVHNHDYGAKLGSITIPLPAGVSIEQPKFSDGDEDSTNDWIRDIGIGQVSWAAPTVASRLSWGRMVTIIFVANGPPVRGVIRLIRSDTGNAINIKSLAAGPAAVAP
jgi:hypothetical protein